METNEAVDTTTASGAAPQKRVANIRQARKTYRDHKRAAFRLAVQRAKIKAQLDRSPPFNQAERKRRGLDWLSNVGFGENWSICRDSINALWNMFTTGFSMYDITSVDRDPQAPHLDYGAIIGEEASAIMGDDLSFHFHTRQRMKQFFYWGIGAVLWPDEYTWKAEFIHASNIILPPDAVSCGKELDYVQIRDELDLSWLYQQIEAEDAKESGWRVEEVRKLLINTYKKGLNRTDELMMSEPEGAVQKLKNYYEQADNQFQKLRVVHVLAKELDEEGGITHIIMADAETAGSDEMDFLFYSHRRFPDMERVLNVMVYDDGDGFWSSVRGLAWELFPTTAVNDRLTNGLLDGAIIQSGLVVQGQTPEDSEEMASVVKLGPVTHLPAGVNVLQQRSFAPSLEQLVFVRSVVQGIQQNNTGSYKHTDENQVLGQQGTRSATEVSIQAGQQAKMQAATSSWAYVQWEPFLRETLRRLMNSDYPPDAEGYEEHKKFMERCQARGVPKAWLNYERWSRIRAERAIGMGSVAEARQLTEAALAKGNLMPENGRKRAMEDWVGVRFGYHKVGRYMPAVDPTTMMTQEGAIAQLENNDFAMGQSLQAGVDHPHSLHLTWHFRWLSEFVKPFLTGQWNKNMLPSLIAGAITCVDHCMQHVELLGRDPTRKGEADAWKGPIDKFQKLIMEMRRTMQQVQKMVEQQQAEAERQAQDDDTRERDLEKFRIREEIRSKERLQKLHTLSLDRSRDAKTQSAIENTERKVEAEIQREDKKADAEINRKDKKGT